MADLKTSTQVQTGDWGMESTQQADSNIVESYSIADAKVAGWRIRGTVCLNSNGNPYLKATKANRGGALYLSNGVKENLLGKALSTKPADKLKQLKSLEGVKVTADAVQLIVIKNDDDTFGFLIGRAGSDVDDLL